MQQFVVPQFIDVEDQIFGPVTTRQFLILLVGGLLVFLAYRFGDATFFIAALAFIGGFSLVLAFVKVNGQSFHYFLLNVFQTFKKPSLRIWRKDLNKNELEYLRKTGLVEKIEMPESKKKVRVNHIRDLALVVNTGGYYQPDDDLWQ